jgi:thiol-disulfide isomerase/thioredoxin
VYAAAQGVELLQVERGWQVRSLAKGLDTSMPLQGGDVVVKVGGRDTATLGPLSICYLLSEAAIRSLPVTVRRQSREVELRLPGAGAGDGGPTLAEFLQRYGIGAQIVSRKDPPRSFINETLPGGPAAKAGLQKGDELIAIDGQQVSALPLAETVQLLVTQQPGTVHLRIRREGRELDVEVQRVPTSQLYGSPRPPLEQMPLPRRGDRAPAFELPDLTGKTHSLDEFRGRWVLLNFWGTWCAPCREEIAYVMNWVKEFGAKLVVLGLDVNDKREELQAFLRELALPYEVLIAGDLHDPVPAAYYVYGVPTNVIVGPDGSVLYVQVGFGPGSPLGFHLRRLIAGTDPQL